MQKGQRELRRRYTSVLPRSEGSLLLVLAPFAANAITSSETRSQQSWSAVALLPATRSVRSAHQRSDLAAPGRLGSAHSRSPSTLPQPQRLEQRQASAGRPDSELGLPDR